MIYKMSTKNLHPVLNVVLELKTHFGFHEDKELADWLGISNKTLSAWKARGKIADYGVFTKRGISEDWLRTGRGEMLRPFSVAEPETKYGFIHPDSQIQAVIKVMEAMDDDTKKDIRLSVEKEKLLRELLKQREDKEAG